MVNEENILRRNIIACYISDIVLGTFFQLPIWIVYQSKFLGFDQIAFFSGIALIAEVLSQLPTGAFADLYGRRLSLSLGNFFMALPMFLMAFCPKPEIMFFYSVMWGLGRAFAIGTSKPILYETLKKHGKSDLYPRILSRSVIFFQLSAAVSIASGGYLYQVTPNLPYIVSGLTSLVGVVTAFLFIEERTRTSENLISKFVKKSKNGIHEIFKNNFVAKLTVLYALTLGIAQASQQFFAQPFMVELGMNDIERSWVAMIIKISIALLGAKVLASAKIFNNKYFMMIIPVSLVISMVPAGFTTLPWAYAVFVGIAFNSGNTDLFLSPEINKHLDSGIRSTAISLQRMLASLVGALIQWLSIGVVLNGGVGKFYSYLGFFSLVVIIPLAYNLMLHKHKFNVTLVENLATQLK